MEDRDPQTHAIIGAAMEVHTELERGFLESVYQEALAREFKARRIPFGEQSELPIQYKGERLATYFPDILHLLQRRCGRAESHSSPDRC